MRSLVFLIFIISCLFSIVFYYLGFIESWRVDYCLRKKEVLLLMQALISFFVVVASVAIWIGICWWNFWVGLILLYTLIPASCAFACLTVVITAVVISRRKREAELLTHGTTIQFASEEPQQHKYCPNCGTPYTLELKQCENCAYEL